MQPNTDLSLTKLSMTTYSLVNSDYGSCSQKDPFLCSPGGRAAELRPRPGDSRHSRLANGRPGGQQRGRGSSGIGGASTVVMLANMLTDAEIANAQEMAEILEDTQNECQKHGKVLAIASPKPGTSGSLDGAADAATFALKVLVQFDTVAAATACAALGVRSVVVPGG